MDFEFLYNNNIYKIKYDNNKKIDNITIKNHAFKPIHLVLIILAVIIAYYYVKTTVYNVIIIAVVLTILLYLLDVKWDPVEKGDLQKLVKNKDFVKEASKGLNNKLSF